MRGQVSRAARPIPDFASLHPGYKRYAAANTALFTACGSAIVRKKLFG
jgi:hypothetical protein